MDKITIRQCTIADLESAPNLAALLNEYARESAISEFGQHFTKPEIYRNLENAGVLRAFGAFKGEMLVGFLLMVAWEIPHYGTRAANTESFFVTSSARKGGTGIKLLRAAEDFARSQGAVGFLISAPVGGRLAKAAPMMGYRETSRLFFRSLA